MRCQCRCLCRPCCCWPGLLLALLLRLLLLLLLLLLTLRCPDQLAPRWVGAGDAPRRRRDADDAGPNVPALQERQVHHIAMFP